MPVDEQQGESGEGAFEVVWPLARVANETFTPKERPGDLNGKTVAFIWDYLFRGDDIFSIVEAELLQRFPEVNIVGYEAFGNIHGKDHQRVVAELPGRLSEHGVDAAIVGVGA